MEISLTLRSGGAWDVWSNNEGKLHSSALCVFLPRTITEKSIWCSSTFYIYKKRQRLKRCTFAWKEDNSADVIQAPSTLLADAERTSHTAKQKRKIRRMCKSFHCTTSETQMKGFSCLLCQFIVCTERGACLRKRKALFEIKTCLIVFSQCTFKCKLPC